MHTHTHILNYDEKATINLILEVIQQVILTHDLTIKHIIEKKKKRKDKESIECPIYSIVNYTRTFTSHILNIPFIINKLSITS